MKNAIAFGSLTVGLLLGALWAGRASAQQPYAAPPGNRFQYQCLTKLESRIYTPEAQAKLNEMGAQGWRLMENRSVALMPGQSYSDVYCFERRY